MKIYTVFDVANYFLSLTNTDEGDLMSNLKLQKLCYYAQGVASVVRDEPLFSESLEAWAHGPVVPELYQRYKNYKATNIPLDNLEISNLDFADIELLNDVYDTYGQYAAWKLSEMTHNESPWVDSYKNRFDKTITAQALRDYFTDEVGESYRASYRGKYKEHQKAV